MISTRFFVKYLELGLYIQKLTFENFFADYLEIKTKFDDTISCDKCCEYNRIPLDQIIKFCLFDYP